jgi:hypothetical protein
MRLPSALKSRPRGYISLSGFGKSATFTTTSFIFDPRSLVNKSEPEALWPDKDKYTAVNIAVACIDDDAVLIF